MGAQRERVDRRGDERSRNRLQRNERERRVHQRDGRAGQIEDRREVIGPVRAFNRVAETPKCARRRLREDAEVDQIAVRGVLYCPQPREECRIGEASNPEAAGRARATAARCYAAANTAR